MPVSHHVQYQGSVTSSLKCISLIINGGKYTYYSSCNTAKCPDCRWNNITTFLKLFDWCLNFPGSASVQVLISLLFKGVALQVNRVNTFSIICIFYLHTFPGQKSEFWIKPSSKILFNFIDIEWKDSTEQGRFGYFLFSHSTNLYINSHKNSFVMFF